MLSKILKISISDLEQFLTIADKKPDNGVWSPDVFNELLDDWNFFKSTKVPVEQYKTIVSGNNEASYILPIDETLIATIAPYISIIETITTDSSLNKDQQTKDQVRLFSDSLKGNAALMSALSAKLIQKDDIVIKTAIESFTIDSELDVPGSAGEMLQKLKSLDLLLKEYKTWKFTPLIFKHFGFNLAEIVWLKENSAALQIEPLWMVNSTSDAEVYEAFRKLFYLSELKNTKTKSATSWTMLMTIAISNQSKSDFADAFTSFSGVSTNSTSFLIGAKEDANIKGSLNLAFPTDFLNAMLLLYLVDAGKTVDKIGGDQAQLSALIDTEPNKTTAPVSEKIFYNRSIAPKNGTLLLHLSTTG